MVAGVARALTSADDKREKCFSVGLSQLSDLTPILKLHCLVDLDGVAVGSTRTVIVALFMTLAVSFFFKLTDALGHACLVAQNFALIKARIQACMSMVMHNAVTNTACAIAESVAHVIVPRFFLWGNWCSIIQIQAAATSTRC